MELPIRPPITFAQIAMRMLESWSKNGEAVKLSFIISLGIHRVPFSSQKNRRFGNDRVQLVNFSFQSASIIFASGTIG
jgi:hypothetical protein